MNLRSVAKYLDRTLEVAEYSADSSMNGLQVECSRRITRIATAVDACTESISRASRWGAELLVVHHGLFWGDPAPLTGVMGRRIGLLFSKGVSLYAAHLPLDCHSEIGNNAGLAQLLGLEEVRPFALYHGITIGLEGKLPRRTTARSLAARLGRKIGSSPEIFPFGPSEVSRIGVVSGGGASLVQQASEAGCDALVTGETSHTFYHTAREARINLICGGHYATETIGVRALARLVQSELEIPARFIDVPTGL